MEERMAGFGSRGVTMGKVGTVTILKHARVYVAV